MTGQAGQMVQDADLSPGRDLPALQMEPITRRQLVKYADASGDPNRIHLDDSTARAVGLDGVIAHGMLSMAFLGSYLCSRFGPEGVRRLSVRFKAIVRPGDVLTCHGRISAIEQRDGTERILLEVWAANQSGERVTAGDAEVDVR